MRLINLITDIVQIVSRKHENLQTITASQHHTKYDPFDPFLTMLSHYILPEWHEIADGAGSITVEIGRLQFTSGNVTDNDIGIYSKRAIPNIVLADKQVTFQIPILYTGGASHKAWIVFNSDANYPPGATDHHFGFYLEGASLKATNGDGTTQTLSDSIAILPDAEQFVVVKAVYTEGVDIKYYVNNVLKVTHTTHLPGAGDYYIVLLARTLADAIAYFTLGRLLYERTQ